MIPFLDMIRQGFVTEIINGSDNLPVDKKFINFFKNLN